MGFALPRDIVSMMERFGRYEMDPQGSGEDGSDIGRLMGELYPFASAEPERFLDELAATVVPVGGWAVYGASRMTWELLSPDRGSPVSQHPAYTAIMDGAIAFLRSSGVRPKDVRNYEWDYWLDHGGTLDTWLPRRPTPSQDEAPITPLRPGETRKVAQLTASPDSPVFLVRQKDDGRYGLLTDARKSDDDPQRTRWEWKSAESLYALYIEIGLSQQTPTYWYDPELEPYFPLPRPKI